MKKLLAVILAVIMAFGCTAVAFADSSTPDWTCPYCGANCYYGGVDADTYQAAHYKVCTKYPADATNENQVQCPYCNQWIPESAYNTHIQICQAQTNNDVVLGDLTVSNLVDRLISVFETNANWWDEIEDIIIRLMDFVENIGTTLAGKADVEGAIADLEAKVGDLGIVGDVLEYIENIINTIKQKIKDLYAGNKETEAVEETAAEEEVVETTEAETPADTGSTTIGLAALAAVSVAAAAAYVCTKKKED